MPGNLKKGGEKFSTAAHLAAAREARAAAAADRQAADALRAESRKRTNDRKKAEAKRVADEEEAKAKAEREAAEAAEAKAKVEREAAEAKAKAEREAAAKAKAEARAARIKAGDLDARFTHGDHMLDTVPLPSDLQNASRDALAALHLNQSCTGLGENDALFELRYCDLNPDQRKEMIEAAKDELNAEAEHTRDAQPGILAAYRKAMSAERIIYVCACCGLRNFSVTGEFREMSLDRLEPLRYTASKEDTERWERITRAHSLTEAESGKPYSCVFNYYIYILRGGQVSCWLSRRGRGEARPPEPPGVSPADARHRSPLPFIADQHRACFHRDF